MMKTNNNYSVRMDLSIMPKDIINCISKHLIDFPVLEDKKLKYERKNIYLLYFFYYNNLPKDARKYNKFMESEKTYYKKYDFTHHNKQKLKPILKIIRNKYKDMHLKTYDISFDDATYKRWKYLNLMDGITLYKFNIYDINNKTGLGLSNEGITKITHEGLNTTCSLSLYKDLQLTNKEIQLFKTTLKNIENDIKYYIQQCFLYNCLPSFDYDD